MSQADVQVSIGGDLTPLQQSFAQAKIQATAAGKAIGDSLGVEGLKGEGRLHGALNRMVRDLIQAKDPASALGAVVEGLGDSFRLSAAAMVAFLATSKLAEMLYGGYQAAEKARLAITDTLSITATATQKSIAQVNDELARLRQDAEANNLGAMDRAIIRLEGVMGVLFQFHEFLGPGEKGRRRVPHHHGENPRVGRLVGHARDR